MTQPIPPRGIPNNGPQILGVSISLVTLSGIIVGARILVRRSHMAGSTTSWDDWFIVVAWVSDLVLCVSGPFVTDGGYTVIRPGSIDSRQPMYVLLPKASYTQVTSDLMKAPNTCSGNKVRLWQALGRPISRRFSSGRPCSYTLR